MKKSIILFLLVSCFIQSVSGQSRNNYSDDLLTSSFKVFQTADFELAYHILPFLRKRFMKELDDTSSFSNPYDSLSHYIDIKYSQDSIMKTYCWSERNGSCCHSSSTFVQFKTESGEINYVDLEELEKGDNEEIFITDVQMIEIQNKACYLILGWGTCCGGKHYGTARVYEIVNNTLVKSDAIFGDEDEIYIGANRSQKIELKYSLESKTLSYNSYEFNDDIGFYKDEKSIVEWTLTKKGFKRNN